MSDCGFKDDSHVAEVELIKCLQADACRLQHAGNDSICFPEGLVFCLLTFLFDFNCQIQNVRLQRITDNFARLRSDEILVANFDGVTHSLRDHVGISVSEFDQTHGCFTGVSFLAFQQKYGVEPPQNLDVVGPDSRRFDEMLDPLGSVAGVRVRLPGDVARSVSNHLVHRVAVGLNF